MTNKGKQQVTDFQVKTPPEGKKTKEAILPQTT